MDLRLSDAGIYMLNVYHNNDQTELERKVKYQLHIQGKVKTDQTSTFCSLDFLIMLAMEAE